MEHIQSAPFCSPLLGKLQVDDGPLAWILANSLESCRSAHRLDNSFTTLTLFNNVLLHLDDEDGDDGGLRSLARKAQLRAVFSVPLFCSIIHFKIPQCRLFFWCCLLVIALPASEERGSGYSNKLTRLTVLLVHPCSVYRTSHSFFRNRLGGLRRSRQLTLKCVFTSVKL